ncbi:MAG: RNA polymerase sigma factor [Eubacteriales bacterium]|nr:RNA polymerase sigma factor [Eubacteriales bacterium]
MSTQKRGINELDITQVYNDNKNSVYRLALTYLHSQTEAEDVCHDVFIKMMEHKNSIFPGKERAWLLTVTANECKNRLKFWKRHANKEICNSLCVKETQSLDILETVMSLSVKERTVIYLYYYEGYTTEEIAGILKITASAVRSRMERARKHLKYKLEGELS